jgi:hypothetical protein
MNNFSEARRAASYYIQSAIVAECVHQDMQEYLRFTELGFEAERKAAFFLLEQFDKEPMRSVCFRSAAWLALHCKKYSEAKKMVYFGLAGNAPEAIVEELIDAYDAIERELILLEIPAESLPVPKNRKSTNYVWLKGALMVADAHECQITLVLEDHKTAKIKVTKDLGEIVRTYWNEQVHAYTLKQGKRLTLVDIDKIFMQKTA